MKFLIAQQLKEFFYEKLNQIEQESPTAKTQKKSHCCNSGVCCWKRPGALSKEDIKPIADKLGITETELFEQYLIVDEIGCGLKLLPARKHQKEQGMCGSMIGWEETYSIESPCVFLDENNRCGIHEVKPKECREFRCWNIDPKQESPEIDKQILYQLGWDGEIVE